MALTFPIIIKKHPIGLVAIFLLGAVAMLLLLYGIYTYALTPGVDKSVVMWVAIVAVVGILTITFVSMYVYSLSSITLTQAGLTADNWLSLFSEQDSTTEWSRVQSVDQVKANLFNQVFGYGTLNIQTAGTYQKVRMTMVPNAKYWQRIIEQISAQSTPDNSVDLSTIDTTDA